MTLKARRALLSITLFVLVSGVAITLGSRVGGCFALIATPLLWGSIYLISRSVPKHYLTQGADLLKSKLTLDEEVKATFSCDYLGDASLVQITNKGVLINPLGSERCTRLPFRDITSVTTTELGTFNKWVAKVFIWTNDHYHGFDFKRYSKTAGDGFVEALQTSRLQ